MMLAAAMYAQPDSAHAAAIDRHYTTASLSAQEQEAGNLLNYDRSRYNLPALTIDPALSRIARIKSHDMLTGGYFAHTSPTYGDVRDMLTHFGYSYTAAGENIARYATLQRAQAALLSSPGHRRNILSTGYDRVGVGVALSSEGHVYLTQIFCR
ncbi:MAG: serine protease, partial [Clostridia bacterium]|nr:serine protease [Clostridia bacterium]